MTGIVKSIGKAVKKVASGVKKVYNKITSTTLGKVLLAGAAIYLGGAALGKWAIPKGIPFASKINGAFVGGTNAGAGGGLAGNAAVPAGNAATVNTAAGLTTTALPPAGIDTVTVTGVRGAAAGLGAPSATGAAAAASPALSATAPALQTPSLAGVQGTEEFAAATTGNKAGTGLISKIMTPVNKMATWAGDHPIPAAMLVSGIGNAFSPDALDVEEERRRQEEEDRKRWQENWSVGNVDLGMRPANRTLQYQSGGPVYNPATGAINRARG